MANGKKKQILMPQMNKQKKGGSLLFKFSSVFLKFLYILGFLFISLTFLNPRLRGLPHRLRGLLCSPMHIWL